MLVLHRKLNQSIKINDNITITVVQVGPGSVRLGIEAPLTIPIVRSELNDNSTNNCDPDTIA